MGTTSLSGTIQAIAPSVQFVPTIGSGLNIATSTAAQLQASLSAAIGTAAGQWNIGYIDQVAVATGTPFTINCVTGNEPTFGNAMGMGHLGLCYFVNLSTTTAQIFTVGSGTHPAMGSDQFSAQANGGHGWLCQPNPGYALVGATNDTITVTVASGSGVAGILVLLGRTT